jgi:hypothetical protein
MERLEEYKAGRKSKSLEETKGEHLMRINPSTQLFTESDMSMVGPKRWAS